MQSLVAEADSQVSPYTFDAGKRRMMRISQLPQAYLTTEHPKRCPSATPQSPKKSLGFTTVFLSVIYFLYHQKGVGASVAVDQPTSPPPQTSFQEKGEMAAKSPAERP